ncbi:MAG: YifB family Mg chelatase-like AAA ATPase [Alphaproteobacteria bacterium]|nr:YifB family Mg chelatase-like AAA ATPase [Alphaproteobacteria bacterium]
MHSRIYTVSFQGVEAQKVSIEVQISGSVPAFVLVGLAEKAVAESKERVRAALHSMGMSLPRRRITVNLAPADMIKEGSHFDLPIAVALLCAMEVLPADEMSRYVMLGELSLTGSIEPVLGVLPAAVAATRWEHGLICPAAQGSEALWSGNDDILAPASLWDLIHHFKGDKLIAPPQKASMECPSRFLDLKDIKGQETAKRALEIAAAGGHNMLMVGPPGAGKSMLAARLPGLLPPMTQQEILEVSMIHSVAGLLKDGHLVTQRPFRDPHHSASMPALVGGSIKARPGEVSLAHRGVLFLDELPEFQRATLEALRQPLETGYVTVARANAHITYPARFQLVAAMNPCRCGYLGTPGQECSRAPKCAEEYQAKISGPLLDRIDLHVNVPAVLPTEISTVGSGESSVQVAERIQKAMALQTARYKGTSIIRNAEADASVLDKIVPLQGAELAFMTEAANRLHLTARSFHRVLRVARTIADLAQSEAVQVQHLAEALSFRARQGV